MKTTLTNITEATKGKLVSTTDMKRARSLNKRVSVRQIVAGRMAHFELVDGGTLLLYVRRELYELKLA